MSPINRSESQQWMIKAYTKCRDLIGITTPNYFSMVVYKDEDFIKPADRHKLKRELAWERNVLDVGNLVRAVAAILSVAAIFVLLILLVCGVKRRPRTKPDSVGQQPVHQEDPAETLQVKTKKKLSLKRLMRRSFRRCCVQTQAQARQHELKTRKRVAVHQEHSQRKLVEWNKARERSLQRKGDKVVRYIEKEYDRRQKSKEGGVS